MMELFFLMKQELLVTAIIFAVIFLKLANRQLTNNSLISLMNILLSVNVIAGFVLNKSGSLFGDMYSTNPLLSFEKNLLNIGALIVSLQSSSWLRRHDHLPEFYILLLSSLLGMFFTISSSNLLMFYTGLELSTLPLAALANFDLLKRRSSEGAIKFIVSSAFSSALMLFGISLFYGISGSLNFEAIGAAIRIDALDVFAFVLFLSGFAFKISIVPFHLWTADVYEGAPTAITAYLSAISKASVIFVFLSVLHRMFHNMETLWYNMIFLLSVTTMIVGNLFALRQDNMKRFLAFSSIAQVGFILVGISGQSSIGASAVVFFVMIYIFSNLGAFGIVTLMHDTGREHINDYRGLYKTNPMLCWILTICLFSLAGIPPTAGFFGKFFLLIAGAAKQNYLFITIAALNMIISLYYYLRIVRAMFMDESATPAEKLETPASSKIAFVICISGILITGLASGAYQYVYNLISAL